MEKSTAINNIAVKEITGCMTIAQKLAVPVEAIEKLMNDYQKEHTKEIVINMLKTAYNAVCNHRITEYEDLINYCNTYFEGVAKFNVLVEEPVPDSIPEPEPSKTQPKLGGIYDPSIYGGGLKAYRRPDYMNNLDNNDNFTEWLEEDNVSEWGYDEETSAEDIDNSAITYTNKTIYIRLNSKKNWFEKKRYQLDTSEKLLKKKFPKLNSLPGASILQSLYEGILLEGLKTDVLIRNLSMADTKGEEGIIALRPERYPGDFLSEWIPDDKSIMFRGHLDGVAFVVDNVYDTPNDEALDYEIKCAVTRLAHPHDIKKPFLYGLISNSKSLAEHTKEKLDDWEAYLQWDKELLEAHTFGCRYTDLYVDHESGKLIIMLQFPNYSFYKKNKAKLSRDIALFDLSYSQDEWDFRLADFGRKGRFNSKEIGAFIGIEDEYPENEEEDGTYIVKASYELLPEDQQDYDDIDWNDDNSYFDFDDLDRRIREYYQTDGFLAESAIGSLALNRKLKTAIENLEKDIECYSPNIALWLFDIRQARLPKSEDIFSIDNWLNPDIENNENQKNAVLKMLAAPDVCLIQGPPGTGKTTVIAEAVYQFTSRGNRVLIASQSNDAVDNALERLLNSPVIRAIRLGISKRKKAQHEYQDKFSEKTALKCFFQSLAESIEKKWVDNWEHGDKYLLECAEDTATLENLWQKDASLWDSVKTAKNEINTLEKSREGVKEDIEKAVVHNEQYEQNKVRLEIIQKIADGDTSCLENITVEIGKIIGDAINDLIASGKKKGIKLLIGSIDTELFTRDVIIKKLLERLFINVATLEKLSERLLNFSSGKLSPDRLLELEILSQKISEIRQLMEDTEDEEKAFDLLKEIKILKKKQAELNTGDETIKWTAEEAACLEPAFMEAYDKSRDYKKAGEEIAGLISMYYETLQKTAAKFSAEVKQDKMIDICEFNLRKKEIEEQIALAEEKLGKQQAEKEAILVKVDEIRRKYLPENEPLTILEILKVIDDRKNEVKLQIEASGKVRDIWGETLLGFRNRLKDEKLFRVDQQYYQKVYVNACNVVGVSCTGNMKELNDRDYEDFDVVVIDEVSKATPPELLIPLMKARKAILVGDHRQLPPMFQEHEKSYSELLEEQNNSDDVANETLTMNNFDIFKKMVTASLFKEYFEQADESIKHSLLVQYRMHSDIMDVINRFYENRLSAGLSAEEENIRKNHGLTIAGADGTKFIRPDCHAYWIDSSVLPSGQEAYENFNNGSTSSANVLEQFIVIETLRKIAEEYSRMGYGGKKKKTVGIISFYMRQVREIKKMYQLEKKKNPAFNALDVVVNTVDRFQGQEKNIIICSLVRNNKQAKASGHVVAFERINVAFSRAQELLVIVGAKHLYHKSMVMLPHMDHTGKMRVPVYKNIMEELNRKAAFMPSNKIITAEIEDKIIKGTEKKRGTRKN